MPTLQLILLLKFYKISSIIDWFEWTTLAEQSAGIIYDRRMSLPSKWIQSRCWANFMSSLPLSLGGIPFYIRLRLKCISLAAGSEDVPKPSFLTTTAATKNKG